MKSFGSRQFNPRRTVLAMSTDARHDESLDEQPRRQREDVAEAAATPAPISGHRRAEHSDLPRLEGLMRPATRELFGDVEPGRL